MTRTSLTAALLLGVMVSLFCAPASQAQVYKKVLEDGTVVYTDKKEAGSEEVQVESVVSEFAPVNRGVATNPPMDEVDASKDGNGKASIAITSPANEETIRSNEGIVDVAWAARTGRNIEERLNYKLWVDGQLVYEGEAVGVTLRDVNRGEHRLQVRVFDEKGSELAASDTTVIYVQQATIYNPALNTNGISMGGASGQN